MNDEIDQEMLDQFPEIMKYEQIEEVQNLTIEVSNFQNIGIAAPSVEDYCRPYTAEILCLDYDDVCRVAITIAKTLLTQQRIEEF